jgi:hypothetical protein
VDREIIRVDVLPLGAEPDKRFTAGVKCQLQPVKPPRTRLAEKADLAISLFHKPSLRSLEVWTSGPREAALEKAHRILFTQVAVQGGPQEAERAQVIRIYDLGLGSRIKDLRSGRTTARLAQVFKGHLEMLHPGPSEQA